MSIKDMKKEDLELLSYKDITNLLLEEYGAENTAELFKKIVKLLKLPSSVFDNKIGDYYTMLSTDKRFILLEDGKWDLRTRHTSDKIVNVIDEDDELSYINLNKYASYGIAGKNEYVGYKTKFAQEEIDENMLLKFIEKHGIKEEVEECD